MEINQHNRELPQVDKEWTLFLDRDGVINVEKDEDYVRNAGEFQFCFQATDALAILAKIFGKIFIVTNQRGVGRGLMTETDLQEIHVFMVKEIDEAGGRIDRIYYCIDIDTESQNRKPNPGMGQQAKQEFPEVDFNKAIMVGNAMSDMQFGKNLDMFTIYMPSGKPMNPLPDPLIDSVFPSLYLLAKALQKQIPAQ